MICSVHNPNELRIMITMRRRRRMVIMMSRPLVSTTCLMIPTHLLFFLR